MTCSKQVQHRLHWMLIHDIYININNDDSKTWHYFKKVLSQCQYNFRYITYNYFMLLFFFFSVGGRASLRQWRTVKYQLYEGQVQGVSSSKTEDLRSAQRIHLLEHMFQMTAITPQTPDFYLWGFLRAHVYENCSQSIAELKVAIIQKICAIRKEECVRVTDNSARRLQECLRHNGGHLEHIL